MTVKVSAIIPTYNNKALLKDAIDCVLSQSFQDIELIVIDDGSTDDTAALVKSIDDSRLKYFYKVNGGVSSARNMGLDKANGQYIAFLDADDLWKKDFLQTMFLALEQQKQFGLAYTTVTNKYSDGRTVEKYREKYCISGKVSSKLFEIFFVITQASLIRKEVLENFRFDENLTTGEDGDFFLRLSLKIDFLFVPSNMAIRRIQTESLSQSDGQNKVDMSRLRVLERFYHSFGGKEMVTKKTAAIRFTKAYREVGTQYYNIKARKAAIYLFKKALTFDKFSTRNYRNLIKSYMIPEKMDSIPDWQFPEPLPEPIFNCNTDN